MKLLNRRNRAAHDRFQPGGGKGERVEWERGGALKEGQEGRGALKQVRGRTGGRTLEEWVKEVSLGGRERVEL